jgi:hypothetical protein
LQILGGGKICPKRRKRKKVFVLWQKSKILAAENFAFLQAFGVIARQTPKPPIVLSQLRRLRGVDEPLTVTLNIYASTRLARTQARLPLNGNSTLVTLRRAGRRAAEPRKALFFNFISRGTP